MSATNKIVKVRESNLELLRIVSMLMIIFHHYIMHGIILPCEGDPTLSQSINFSDYEAILKSVNFGGRFGINCFVLISGYFMIKQAANLRKILILWVQVVFYTVVLFFVTIYACDSYRESLPIIGYSSVFSLFFPLFFGKYWFITTYVALCLISPYLNLLLTRFSKKDFQKYLFILLLCSLCFQGGVLISFIFLYSLAAYIRLYSPFQSRSGIFWLLLTLVGCAIHIIATIFAETFTLNSIVTKIWALIPACSICVMSVCSFMFFRSLRIKPSRLINAIAATTLGIYLIHDHTEVRRVLWKYLCVCDWVQHPYFILHCVVSVLGIFLVCSLLDYIRMVSLSRFRAKCVDFLLAIIEKVRRTIPGATK